MVWLFPRLAARAGTSTPVAPGTRSLHVPILLYHHIGDPDPDRSDRYTIRVASFEQQMRSLKAWGYTTITLANLISAMENGDPLPPRPVIITFDDGYQDVFTNAFPILDALDYDATVFIIGRQMGLKGYLGNSELKELAAQGWQVGNHTYNHHSLRSAGINLELEIETSRTDLEKALAVPVCYFSFPYGLTSQYVARQVVEAGYTAAVGLGGSYVHSPKTRFYLSRIEIRPETSALDFMELLPWAGPPGGRGSWNGLAQ